MDMGNNSSAQLVCFKGTDVLVMVLQASDPSASGHRRLGVGHIAIYICGFLHRQSQGFLITYQNI